VEIRRLGPADETEVARAQHLFDKPADAAATRRFLASDTHHLLLALVDDRVPAGFVSGMEITHPDKGTEMLLYELGVDEPYRRRGVARALVSALSALAAERGCTNMWVLADEDNEIARATYAALGATREDPCVMFTWEPL
jgi:ribosomal protein S18 acetylase RimI-like enzyme